MGKQEAEGAARSAQNPRYSRGISDPSLPLPGRRLAAMDQQSGLAMQAAQSFPQQFVQLVGHRQADTAKWIRPQLKSRSAQRSEPDAPIG